MAMSKEEKIKFLASKIAGSKAVMEKVEQPGFKPKPQQTNQTTVVQPRQEEIYKRFMENPIVDPTAPMGMEYLTEEIQKRTPQPAYAQTQSPVPSIHQLQHSSMEVQLIEHIIKKTVEEVLKQLNEQTNINENIQIKIGSKTFGGKITVLKEQKTSK